MVGLCHYKWYQSQTPSDVPARRLFPEGGRYEVMCQLECWALKGSGVGKGPTSIRERNEWQWRCWALKGGGLWYTLVGEKNETPSMRVWKPFSGRQCFRKHWGEAQRKVQQGQYLLALGLYCYNFKLKWRILCYEDININYVRIQK